MTVATQLTVPYAYLNRQYEDIEPYLDDIRRLAKSGDFTLGYPVTQFEDTFSQMTGQHAVGASSGTAALVLALRALGIGPGDEVIVPCNTFVASAGAVAMVGATPVFCDVMDDFTISVGSAQQAITENTKAIIAVHLTGTMADMQGVMAVAKRHDLYCIEDAAQAMGARYLGMPAGWHGDAAAWSMHPLKMINVWGDAGAVTTLDPNLDAEMRLLRNHGLKTRDDAVIFGDNLRISSLQAAIACRALERADWARAERRRRAGQLQNLLGDLYPRVKTPVHGHGVEPVYATYVLRVEDREGLRAHLLECGIDVKVHYPKPLHLQTVGLQMGYREGQFPVAEGQAHQILSLPMHEYLTDAEVTYMNEQIHGYYRHA